MSIVKLFLSVYVSENNHLVAVLPINLFSVTKTCYLDRRFLTVYLRSTSASSCTSQDELLS